MSEGEFLSRQQRRLLERQERKLVGLGKPDQRRIPPHDLVTQINTVGERNRGLDLAEVNEEDRNRVVLLSAQLYKLARPSNLSLEELVNSVTFEAGVSKAAYSKPAPKELQSAECIGGRITVRMGSEGFLAKSYDANVEPYYGRILTPLSILAQVLIHEFHHRESQDPKDPEDTGGFIFRTFNEISTEYLTQRALRRFGFIIVERYLGIIEQVHLLEKLLQENGISEDKFFELYRSGDEFGLVSLLARKKFSTEYERVRQLLEGAEQRDRKKLLDNKDFEKLLRYGTDLMRAIENGDPKIFKRLRSRGRSLV